MRHPGALGDDPAELTQLELRSLVTQEWQPDPLTTDVRERDVHAEQALSYSGALSSALPVGEMTSDPPQNEIDSSTPTRLQKTTNEVVSWA